MQSLSARTLLLELGDALFEELGSRLVRSGFPLAGGVGEDLPKERADPLAAELKVPDLGDCGIESCALDLTQVNLLYPGHLDLLIGHSHRA